MHNDRKPYLVVEWASYGVAMYIVSAHSSGEAISLCSNCDTNSSSKWDTFECSTVKLAEEAREMMIKSLKETDATSKNPTH